MEKDRKEVLGKRQKKQAKVWQVAGMIVYTKNESESYCFYSSLRDYTASIGDWTHIIPYRHSQHIVTNGMV